MSHDDIWPDFGRTELPETGLWSAVRAFAGDLRRQTGGRVEARLDAIKVPHVPLGKAFELSLAVVRERSRAVSILQLIEQAEGLLLRGPGEHHVLARTEEELVAFLRTFVASSRVVEIVRVLCELDRKPS